MSNGFLKKIGRALSIFGVSDPADVRKMQARRAPATAAKPAPAALPHDSAVEDASQEKRTADK
jgi:hypothetical protein